MLIGLTTTFDTEKDSERTNVEYLDCVRKAGGIPLLIPPLDEVLITPAAIDEILGSLQGAILTGGGDIDPFLYHETPLPTTVGISRKRDLTEMALARRCRELNIPLFGICRGMQIMNVALGGSLCQDVRACGTTDKEHSCGEPYGALTQTVRVKPNTKLASLFAECKASKSEPSQERTSNSPIQQGASRSDQALFVPNDTNSTPIQQGASRKEDTNNFSALESRGSLSYEYRTNSLHHQAIKDIGVGLRVNAISEDGIVEGIEDSSLRFFLGVQWHPEYLERDQILFDAFCAAAQDYQKCSTGLSQ